jgi:hypothetical protein
MSSQERKLLVGLAVVTLAGIGLLLALAMSGFGPNIGLHSGYYGRFNQVLALIDKIPDVEVIGTTLHKDLAIEDFYITVRVRGEPELRLCFEGADTRPLRELVQELEKIRK